MTSLNNVVKPSASQVREMNLEIHQKSGKPLVAIVGRTFTIRKVLWVMGGTFNKELKTYEVPEHTAVEAQALADRIGLKIEESMAAAKAKREAKAQEAAK
jgi:hypothetical protein